MSNLTITMLITRDEAEAEIEVTVEGDYTPGRPGRPYLRNGDPGDPPESAEYDIRRVYDSTGKEWDLTDAEIDRALDIADQTSSDMDYDGPDPDDYDSDYESDRAADRWADAYFNDDRY